jgi:hypothetical protein
MDRTAHRLKLAWAQHHIAVLRESILGYGNRKPYRILSEQDPKTGEWRGVFKVAGTPPAFEWSLMVGDSIHNMRGALDALLFEIARQFAEQRGVSMTEKEERAIQFPICDSPKGFDSQRWRLTSLPGDATDIVEGLQPYQPSQKVAHIHPLTLIREISNFDKHRQLLVTAVFGLNLAFGPGAFRKVPGDSTVTELDLDSFPVPFRIGQGIFKDGDVVATWDDGPLAAGFPVDDKLRLKVTIGFTEVAPEQVQHRKVSHLKHVRAWVEERVFGVLEPILR